MLKFILNRILQSIPVLFLVITITFFLIRLAPGGPFDQEKNVPAEVLENLNARYHLNDPLYVQYFDYIKNLLRFDFGPSFKYPSQTVTDMIVAGLPVTFELGFYAIIFALVIGTLAGVIAGLRHNTWLDYSPMAIAMIGICIPSILLGPLLLLFFGIHLEVLPVGGWNSFYHKILPSITLGAGFAAYMARLSRGGMLEVMSQDYIRTARAKGVPEKIVVLKHALRGAIIPVIAFLGPAFAALLTGSFVTETIFQVPGMGRFYVQAAFNRDYTMILGMSILLSALTLVFNMISDIVMVLLNPRLSFQEAAKK